jgi:hypothetical protein
MTDNTMGKGKKDKKTNNDLQNITLNAKNWATRISQKIRVNPCAPEG